MGKRTKSNVIFYFFWACMIFIGSLLGIVLLSRIIPNSLLDAIRGTQTELTVPEKADDPIPAPDMTNQDNQVNQIFIEPPPRTNYSNEVVSIPPSSVPVNQFAPIFSQSTVTPTGKFTNYSGTVFAAGTLFFNGSFPEDFEQVNAGISADSTVKLSFGWKMLPSFEDIKRQSHNESDLAIVLPKLAIIDLKISIQSSPYSNATQDIKDQIQSYLENLFERELVSDRITHIAQQRLAAAYLSQNYAHIKLIPD